MPFNYDARNVSESRYPIITKPGWYPFKIVTATEGKSKNLNPMVVVDSVCQASEFKDIGVRHWVTFLDPSSRGAGIALQFLKAIGQPHEGAVEVDPFEWEGKIFMGKVEIQEYEGKKTNKIVSVSPLKSEIEPEKTEDEIPF